jgi:predicted transcriptional regulator
MPDDERIECPRCAGKGFLTAATTTVGDLIAKRRNELGMTQFELSAAVGVSRAQIANIESGRHDPPISRLRDFGTALKCSMKDLVP